MTFWRVIVTILFFFVITISKSNGDEPHLMKDTLYDNSQINKKDFENVKSGEKEEKIMLAQCEQSSCPKEK